ncbi:MAG: hypothetical protein R2766_01290, partial [Saprospiraceae bacterium]
MKIKLIIVAILVLSTIQIYSQRNESKLSNIDRDSILANNSLEFYSSRISSDQHNYNSVGSRSVNDACTGGDFEIPPIEISGLPPQLVSQEWNFHDLVNYGGLPYGSGLVSNTNPVVFERRPDTWYVDNTEMQTFVQWTSTGFRDQTLAGATPIFTLKTSVSGRGIRLGNDASNNTTGLGRAEAISKTFIVDNSNNIYYFKYAVVGQLSHGGGDAGFFLAQAKDSGGNVIDSYVEIGQQSNPFVTITRNANPVFQGWDDYQYPEYRFYYRDWTCARLDLRGYEGQQVTVSFINSDCAQGAHTSHAYLDEVCIPCKDSEGWIEIASKECLRLPNTINGTFGLPNNQPSIRNVQIKVHLYQGNILKHTYVPIISGNSYSLALDNSMLDDLNCYDIAAELSFELQDGYNPTNYIQYNKLSSYPIKNVVHGNSYGLDNDICFNCCCEVDLAIWSQNGNPIPSAQSAINGNPVTIAGETFEIHQDATIPITELRVATADIQFNYNYDACADCIDNPALWGSLFSSTQHIGTVPNSLDRPSPQWLSEATQLFNTNKTQRELIWSNPNGAILKSGDKFQVNYLLPPDSEIPCCAASAKICTEISWKDANCNLCTRRNCSTIDLSNTNDKLSSSNPMDFAGRKHNELLASVINNKQNLINEEVFEKFKVAHSLEWKSFDNEVNSLSKSSFNEMDSEVFRKYGKIMDEIYKAGRDENSEELIRTRILELEDLIISNEELKYDESSGIANQASFMLGACAIMKYSADFWFDKSDDKQGVFKKIWRDTKAFFSSGCHDGY